MQAAQLQVAMVIVGRGDKAAKLHSMRMARFVRPLFVTEKEGTLSKIFYQ